MPVSLQCQILQALIFFVLKDVAENAEHVFQGYLGCINPTSFASSQRAALPHAAADQAACPVLGVTHRLLVGKSLLIKVSGRLGSSPGQPEDLLQLRIENVSTVYVKFDWYPDDQSFHKVPVLDYGRMNWCTEKTTTDVTVYDGVSKCSISLRVRACLCLDIPLSTLDRTFPHSTPRGTADLDQNRTVQSHMSVRIYTEKLAYAPGVNISFLPVTEEPDPLEFHWFSGDNISVITTSRLFIKTYFLPDRYDVTVGVSSVRGSANSEVHRVLIQRPVRIIRLQHKPTVLLHSALQLSCRLQDTCRLQDGCRLRDTSHVTYHWDFGDGTRRFAQGTVYHVYNRTGEFIVKVTVSNLVSSTSVQGHVFVVSEPCQPPPVKTMGPSKIQVCRSQTVRLGVTYEAQIQCRVSRILVYSWSLYDQAGQQLHIPHTETHRQYLDVPGYFLHYGMYKALAKVQVAGTIVYSNYSVLVEVVPSPPVSFISGSTRLFVSRHNSSSVITLDGRGSHDPDFPDDVMSFSWKCTPVNTVGSVCFTQPAERSHAVLVFPVSALLPGCDLFRFTLTVHSRRQAASSDVFVTVTSKPSSTVQMSCAACRGNPVNWNEQISVTAACERCPGHVLFSWRLFLVNASSRAIPEVPFCGSVDMRLPSSLQGAADILLQPGETAPTSALPVSHPASVSAYLPNGLHHTSAGSALSSAAAVSPGYEPATEALQHSMVNTESEQSSTPAPSWLPPRPLASHGTSVTWEGSFQNLPSWKGSFWDTPSWEGSFQNRPTREGSVEDWEPSDFGSAFDSDLDYEDFYSGIEEGNTEEPLGRPSGPNGLADVIQNSDIHEGDNVVGPNTLGRTEPKKTILDLHRELVQPGSLEAFTHTGTLSSVTIKPSVLKPRSLYMLEVSTSVLTGPVPLQGKAQLFLRTGPSLEGVACQVQPRKGVEVYTVFGLFCMSGQQDLIYEYSFSTGKSLRKLYEGRDYQHYFSLPSGEPHNDYIVTIFIKIGNRFGALARPCPVNVTVLPSFQRASPSHSNPEEELFVHGLDNLTNLLQTKNDRDITNYISLLTGVLNRLSLDPESSVKLLTHTRAALISAGCHVTITNQDLLLDVLHTISDLTKVSNQVTYGSARLVTDHVRDICGLKSLRQSSSLHTALDMKVMKLTFLILSHVLHVPPPSSTLGSQLTQEVLHITSEMVLMYMHSSKESKYSMNSSVLELSAWRHGSLSTAVKTSNVATFYIPDILGGDITRGSRDEEPTSVFLTQLVSYKQNPNHWNEDSAQLIGVVADMRVFNCTTRREIKMRHLSVPLVIEFQKRRSRGDVTFTLTQHEVNTHQFNITPELLHKTIQIIVEFRRPSVRAFPILLLLRIHKKPTPVLYKVQEVYRWKGQMAQMFLPPLSRIGTSYLMLLNADYSHHSRNRYISKAVNYTLSIQAVECLAWDGVREWKPEGCSLLRGVSSARVVNCSCSHLSSFTVSHQTIASVHSIANLTEYTSAQACPVVAVVMVLWVGLYAVLLVFGKDADDHTEKSSRPLFLPDNKPSDHFLYAITIDTGLRSAANMTAKVYIVLYGESGVSESRELSSSEQKLFARNSRNTFILSTPQSLGRVWQVHVWHDGGGSSPSWFLSHVLVRDMVAVDSWLFPGQCWLAVDEGDGMVERRLLVLEQGLPFREMLYCNLTECLEDFHPWLSAYSRPSYSTHTHVQRLSVCFLLLLAYMCTNAVLLHVHDDRYSSELGLINVSPVSMTTGLCGLALLPLGSVVSWLFRISKPIKTRKGSGDGYKRQLPHLDTAEVSGHRKQEVPHWALQNPSLAQNAWAKKCEQSDPDWPTPNFVSCTKQAHSSNLQRSAESTSGIEVIEENVPVDSGTAQGCRFTCTGHTTCGLQSSVAVNASSVTRCSTSSCNTVPAYCYYVSWTLWLFLSLACVIITGTVGVKFSIIKSVLWIQSVFFSFLFCVFIVHPAMVLIFAISVSLWPRQQSYFLRQSVAAEPAARWLERHGPSKAGFHGFSCQHPEEINKHLEKMLAARQRARYLRLVRPPTTAELKCVRGRLKMRTMFNKTIRKLVLHVITLCIVGFVVYGKSSNDEFRLNQALTTQFTCPFNSIHKVDSWWNWTASSLLDGLYDRSPTSDGIGASAKTFRRTFSIIGEPIITNMEYTQRSSHQMDTVCPPAQNPLWPNLDGPVFDRFTVSSGLHPCGKLGCYKGPGISIHLGKNRTEASQKLERLRAEGWLGRCSQATVIRFMLYSPPYSLFSMVTLLGEQLHPGTLISSGFVSTTRLHHPANALGYSVMTAELLLLLLSLVQLCFLTCTVTQRGFASCSDSQIWLEVMILLISGTCFICTVHHFTLKEGLIENLQRDDYKTFVDLSVLSFWEQFCRVIYGSLLFFLLIKCCFLLYLHKPMDSATSTMIFIFPDMFWLLIAGVFLIIALSCLGNLLFHSNPSVFSTLLRSVYFIITRSCGVVKLWDLRHLSHGNQPSLALCCFGALLCVVSLAARALITGAVSFCLKAGASSKRRKHHLSVCKLVIHIRSMVLALAGRGRLKENENYAHTNSLILDEVEDLVDELLFRLSAVSDSHVALAVETENQDLLGTAGHDLKVKPFSIFSEPEE